MLKVGIVGVGQFGQNHARILNESTKCDFVGLYDKNINRAEEISTKLGTKSFKDFDSLLNEIDVLFNVVTTISHFDLAERALKKGIHVFIEKPITETLKQAKDLIELADEKNLKIQVGHIERFNPVILEIEDKVKKPIFMECQVGQE